MTPPALPIFLASFLCVLRVFLVCAAGTWLTRRGTMPPEFRRSLSRLILAIMLPCLLVSKLSANADLSSLLGWGVLPGVALIYIPIGVLISKLAFSLSRTPPEFRRVVTASTAFGNSGYIPFPLVMAVAATAPLFRDDQGAGDRGIAYVSVYLVCMSPCLWGIAYPYLAGKPFGRLRWNQILSPPVLSVFTGVVLGVVPPLRELLVAPTAPLRVLMDAAELIGQGAIPCALLILGANLGDARSGKTPTGIPARSVVAICAGRLVVLPACGCLITLGLLRAGLIPKDPMCVLVLMLEAAVPPATNLIVMCQVHNRGEEAMSRILVWSYIAAIPSLTVWVAVYLRLIESL